MRRRLGLVAALAVFIALIGLGIWQVQRLGWKRALIAEVEAGLAAPASPLPPAASWPAQAKAPEYRKLQLSGHFLPAAEARVQAVTIHGPGVWQMVPFATPEGIVLVNRGFIPAAQQADAFAPPLSQLQIIGLLRHDQPGGGFLRSNDPRQDRWFSRDIQQIAKKLNLPAVAPWFLDLGLPDQSAATATLPIPGLTVVQFRNHHLGYAATWFGLAGLWAVTILALRRGPGSPSDTEADTETKADR